MLYKNEMSRDFTFVDRMEVEHGDKSEENGQFFSILICFIIDSFVKSLVLYIRKFCIKELLYFLI